MKIKNLVIGIFATAMLVSCGNSEDNEESKSSGPSICDCVKLDEERREAEDRDQWEEENKSTWEACEELGNEKQKEIEALESDEEKQEAAEKWMKEIEDCM